MTMTMTMSFSSFFLCLCFIASVSSHAEFNTKNAVYFQRGDMELPYETLEEDFYHDIDDSTVTVGKQFACVLESEDDDNDATEDDNEQQPQDEEDGEYDIGGKPYCWGSNKDGVLNAPDEILLQISAAKRYVCGITLDSRILCWGDPPYAPKQKHDEEYVQVHTADTFYCALTTEGGVRCFGTSTLDPKSRMNSTFVQISGNKHGICGILNNGEIDCWGRARQGAHLYPGGQFVQISHGSANSVCAVDTKGGIQCWGAMFLNKDYVRRVVRYEGDYTQVTVADGMFCALDMLSRLTCFNGPSDIRKSSNFRFLEISSRDETVCGITLEEIPQVKCYGAKQLSRESYKKR